MRLLNICAALSGALALVMLVLAAHALQPSATDAERIHLAAFIQLAAAAAGLAVAGRQGRLNAIAGWFILIGAALFSGTLYAIAIAHTRALVMLAPVGGVALILGWVMLAFARPRS